MDNEKFVQWLMMSFLALIAAAINLLWAFPFMWCWNYMMPYLFKLPTLNWGQSWCFLLVLNSVMPHKMIQKS